MVVISKSIGSHFWGISVPISQSCPPFIWDSSESHLMWIFKLQSYYYTLLQVIMPSHYKFESQSHFDLRPPSSWHIQIQMMKMGNFPPTLALTSVKCDYSHINIKATTHKMNRMKKCKRTINTNNIHSMCGQACTAHFNIRTLQGQLVLVLITWDLYITIV